MILKFLKDLGDNNHKDWMDANRDWYQEVRAEFLGDVEFLLEMMNSNSSFNGSLHQLVKNLWFTCYGNSLILRTLNS